MLKLVQELYSGVEVSDFLVILAHGDAQPELCCQAFLETSIVGITACNLVRIVPPHVKEGYAARKGAQRQLTPTVGFPIVTQAPLAVLGFAIKNKNDRHFTIELYRDGFIKPLPYDLVAVSFKFEPLSPVSAAESKSVTTAEVMPFGALMANFKRRAIGQPQVLMIIPMIMKEVR